ncbi:RNA polymerase sigma factor [Nocardia sp. CA2R105]|uniref:RNA polymerase sigma factor n=1 Tax=Nocardia coffeae TaxID=2873381 RepID=UPI001CA75FA6|nr:RNA polymerase sigma factor [Nocardia coffeae]MBY8856191.1 RNA polymerase sigma factor [Nocardia coffeae]
MYDAPLAELLGAVLREFASDPLGLVSDRPESALVRIGRGERASEPSFDELLVEAYESGHDELLARMRHVTGSSADAEDIVQKALMRVFARRPEHIVAVDKLRGYIWTAAENCLRDEWRRRGKERERIDPAGHDQIPLLADRARLSFDDAVVMKDMLLSCLNCLPPREREAVVLFTYEGHTYRETALILEIAEGTVKGYVHDGLIRMRKCLAGPDNGSGVGG